MPETKPSGSKDFTPFASAKNLGMKRYDRRGFTILTSHHDEAPLQGKPRYGLTVKCEQDGKDYLFSYGQKNQDKLRNSKLGTNSDNWVNHFFVAEAEEYNMDDGKGSKVDRLGLTIVADTIK